MWEVYVCVCQSRLSGRCGLRIYPGFSTLRTSFFNILDLFCLLIAYCLMTMGRRGAWRWCAYTQIQSLYYASCANTFVLILADQSSTV